MDWFKTMAVDARFRNRLVLGLDAKDGLVRTHGWTQSVEESPKAVDIARDMDELPLAAIIYTDISRDGMLKGPNVRATEQLLKVCKNVPIVHSGGVTTLADITALKDLPLQGIIVGRALYEGTLKLEEAVRELKFAGANKD
jgi:phosphoribosylformimino-5-aminoimidazole carboxamide ribotide isomerase